MTRLLIAPAVFPLVGPLVGPVAGPEGAAARPDQVRLSGADHHYLARVLRHRVGDVVRLGDGQGRWARARVVALDDQALTLQAEALELAPEPSGAPPPRLTLLIGLLKGDKLDLVVQKAVELGAARVVPVRCARSVTRLDGDRAQARRERWQRIARGAAQQCGRALAPEIAPIVDLDEVLAGSAAAPGGSDAARRPPLRLMPYEGAVWRPLRDLLPAAAPAPGGPPRDPPAPPAPLLPLWVDVLVGPEGGFTPNEVSAASAAGFQPCGLGPRVLRAETAAIAALAILSALLE